MANCKTCGTVLNTPTGVETVYCRECDPEYLDAARERQPKRMSRLP